MRPVSPEGPSATAAPHPPRLRGGRPCCGEAPLVREADGSYDAGWPRRVRRRRARGGAPHRGAHAAALPPVGGGTRGRGRGSGRGTGRGKPDAVRPTQCRRRATTAGLPVRLPYQRRNRPTTRPARWRPLGGGRCGRATRAVRVPQAFPASEGGSAVPKLARMGEYLPRRAVPCVTVQNRKPPGGVTPPCGAPRRARQGVGLSHAPGAGRSRTPRVVCSRRKNPAPVPVARGGV